MATAWYKCKSTYEHRSARAVVMMKAALCWYGDGIISHTDQRLCTSSTHCRYMLVHLYIYVYVCIHMAYHTYVSLELSHDVVNNLI
jgi:hypothetical protein